MVQQLNLPSPRVFVIKLEMISENSPRMNSPEFSLKITKIRSFTMVHDLSIYREDFRILSHIFREVILYMQINLMALKACNPIYKETSPEDQGAYNCIINIPLL